MSDERDRVKAQFQRISEVIALEDAVDYGKRIGELANMQVVIHSAEFKSRDDFDSCEFFYHLYEGNDPVDPESGSFMLPRPLASANCSV